MAVGDWSDRGRDAVARSMSTPVVEEDETFRLRFNVGGEDPSAGFFLQDLWRVPGRLSGPLRFGATS